jgi:hypothetical protein
MAGFADRVMAKLGHPEPDADEAGGPPYADADDQGESDGDVAIAAVNKNDGAAFEAAVQRIFEKYKK